MERARPNRAVFYALCANAVLLFAILLVLLTRSGATPNSVAFAAPAPQPIAGGSSGMYLMPGQLQKERWGCFVMDVNLQTLCAYEYLPGTRQLQLVAARSVRFDHALENFNTAPAPQEVEQLLNNQGRPRANPGGAQRSNE